MDFMFSNDPQLVFSFYIISLKGARIKNEDAADWGMWNKEILEMICNLTNFINSMAI